MAVAGLKFPHRVGLAAGFRQGRTVADGAVHHGFCICRGGHGHTRRTATREPEAAAVPSQGRPGADQPDGVQQQRGLEDLGGSACANRPAWPDRRGATSAGTKPRPNATRPADDYHDVLQGALHPHVDYFAVNVSSPNTPGLRELQDRAPLTALLNCACRTYNRAQDRSAAGIPQDRPGFERCPAR